MAVERSSIWNLRLDLASAQALLWLGKVGSAGELRPEVHLYLYDRYWRLAACHADAGRIARAAKLRARAEHHYRLSGTNGPPPAVALAMFVPRPSMRTLAYGRDSSEDPDDAA